APSLWPILVEESYQEGQNAVLSCNWKSGLTDGLRFRWTKDAKAIRDIGSESDHVRVTSDSVSSRLTIKNLTMTDAGSYTCEASNQYGSTQVRAQLAIRAELKWIREPSDAVFSVGKDLNIACQAFSEPKPNVRWTKLNDHTSMSELSSGIAVSNLKISSVTTKDSGLYECRATTNGQQEEHLRRVIRIDVKDSSLSLWPILVEESYKEGQDAILSCNWKSGARNGLKFQWSKDGIAISSDDLAQDHVSISNDGSSSKLTIKNLTIIDAGNYNCEASNAYGSNQVSVQLIVQAELKWSQEPDDAIVSVGKELSIDCGAKGEPKPTVKWTRLSSSSPQEIAQQLLGVGSSKLKIAATKRSDAGLYECVASSGRHDESLRKTIKVIVKASCESFKIRQRKWNNKAKQDLKGL
ncbi:Hemicentin-1, partial [Fragariocoptes setiger]